nr:RNB domain-containing ribonuclease [Candidatus Cloacimonadota bacterium]
MNNNLTVPVAYYQNRAIIMGLASPAEGGAWCGVDEKGMDFCFSASRFVIMGTAINTDLEAPAYLSGFRMQIEAEITRLGNMIPEILASGPARLEEIALKLNAKSNSQIFAIYFILVGDPLRFQQKHGVFRLNNAEEQEQIRAAQKSKAERAEFLEEVQSFISGAKLSAETQHQLYEELPLLAQEDGNKDLQRLISAKYPELDLPKAVQKLRLSCGELDPDTDPIVAASGIPVGFSDLNLSEKLLETQAAAGSTVIFSIDDEETRDYDDALSFESLESGYRVGIHVSNVASRLDLQGYLQREACRRGASFYAVNQVIPMLPSRYSEQDLSLVAGTVRPVLSLYLQVDKQGEIVDTELKSEALTVESNLSYRQVDKQIAAEPFATIMRFCEKHQASRDVETQGDKQRYYYYFRMVKDELLLKVIDNSSPARMMVEELMIIFNSRLAELAMANGLPVIYRNVNRYGGTGNESYPSQAYLSTLPEFHPGIGSAAYLHATSPIRRYTDLVNHYQILALLEGKAAPFSEDDLQLKIGIIEKKLFMLKELSHRSNRFW